MLYNVYNASVPVFLRYLDRLAALVREAEKHARLAGLAEQQVLQSRLAPDMLPFAAQVAIAANFCLRTCHPLAGQDVPPFPGIPDTLQGLSDQVTRVRQRVEDFQPAEFVDADTRVIRDAAGQAAVELPAAEFLFQFALPNFFFHLTSAYAILRSAGAPVGKADFDGFHVYHRT